MKTYIKWAARLCLAIVIIALFVGGSQPFAGSLFTPPWDKVVHCIVYGGMMVLAKLAFPHTSLWKLFILVVVIGVLDEVHQMFVPGRRPGLEDLIADVIGVAVATLFLSWLASHQIAKTNKTLTRDTN